MDMEELKNQANELINGNIDSYPALSREAAGKAILMLIEKVENLQEQYERGFKDGHNCCAYEKEKLLAENARYREALLKIKIMTDDPYSILYHVAREALKGDDV